MSHKYICFTFFFILDENEEIFQSKQQKFWTNIFILISVIHILPKKQKKNLQENVESRFRRWDIRMVCSFYTEIIGFELVRK